MLMLKRIFQSFLNTSQNYQRAMNHVSAKVQLSVVGNGSLMQPSVMVSTDKVNYLFNCGEGTQRMIFQHNKHLKLGKIQNVFFTNTIFENWSGFFGFILTSAEIRNEIHIFGPSKFKNIIKLYEQFIYSAGNVKFKLNTIDDGLNSREPVVKNLVDNFDLSIKSISLNESTAYILIIKDKPGKLLLEKCKQFKIPPGPKFASLKNGETIEIDGRLIQPKDVLGPPETGPAFVIMECSASGLTSFLSKLGNFSSYIEGKKLELIIHMSPKEVLDDQQYQSWLKNFNPKIKHLFLNETTQYELGLLSSTELQIKLNLVDNRLFKLLNEKQSQFLDQSHYEDNFIDNCPSLLTYNVRPRKENGKRIEILEPSCCELNQEEICQQIIEQPDFENRLNSYKNQIQQKQQIEIDDSNDEQCFPNVLFLGTASSCPGKQRNTSAIMINLNEHKSILFDCGEGTFLQMNRFFGREHVHEVIANIDAIFISHFHADHHFGLIKLIKERSKMKMKKCNEDPLIIIAPYSIMSFLSLFDSQLEDLSKYYQVIACETLLFNNNNNNTNEDNLKMKQKLLSRLQLDDLVTVSVPHCFESYGIVIKYRDKKIAYSGDSMYSDSFDEAGKDCDLIIHEATMNDDLIQEAISKRHSTISQAINVGRKIGAKYTLLTHFSQRYAKMAPINLIEDGTLKSYIEDHVIIAFDFMQVSLNQLWKAAKLKYPLEILFDEEIQKMQDVVTKRNFKRKLLEEASASNDNVMR